MPVTKTLLIIGLMIVSQQLFAGPGIIPCIEAAEEVSSRETSTLVEQQGPQKNSPEPEEQKTSGAVSSRQTDMPVEAPLKPEEPKAKKSIVDVIHGGISRRILATADWLDSFFLDERALKEENNTYIRLRYDVFPEEKSPVLYEPSFDLRLVLPELRKKTHLFFSSEPSSAPNEKLISPNSPVAQPGERRKVSAGFHYFFKSDVDESVMVRTGAVLNINSPALFVAPRYRLLIPLKPWDFRFSQEAIYRTDTRWLMETQFDFERPLSQAFFFRTNIDGIWKSNTYGYLYSLNFFLREVFSSTQALQYAVSFRYQTRPVHELMEVGLSIGYRQSFWKEWLFYEVVPQCRFPRDRNFSSTPGILFRLEAFFGKTP